RVPGYPELRHEAAAACSLAVVAMTISSKDGIGRAFVTNRATAAASGKGLCHKRNSLPGRSFPSIQTPWSSQETGEQCGVAPQNYFSKIRKWRDAGIKGLDLASFGESKRGQAQRELEPRRERESK